MNPSHLQQLINDKETELNKIRSVANEAALQREHEAREEAQRKEQEVESIRRECEDTIKRATQQIEMEADERIRHAMKEMEQYLEHRQNEIYAAASVEMEKNWRRREDSLKEEVKIVLESELERQHDKLASHYESVIYSKDCDIKLAEEDMKQQLIKAEERHQSEINTMEQKMDQVAKEIWNDAREQFAAAADEEIAHFLATTKSQCKDLTEENLELRRILDEKESIVKDNIRNMKEMEDTFQDVASEVNRVHAREMADISDQSSRLIQDNDRLKRAMHEIGSENDHLRDELHLSNMMNKSLEVKCKDQMKIIDTVDMSKSESSSRINELTACNELLKRQMADLTSEHKALVAENEKQRLIICDLTSENKKQAAAIDELRETNQSSEATCATLMQNLTKAKQQIASLEQERSAYTTQANQLMERNDRLHSEKISLYEQKLASAKDEANAIVQTAQNDLNTLSSECNNLRSRILQLQRDNFRLETDLMDSHQQKQRYSTRKDEEAMPEPPTQDTQKLKDENKALKEIITMMRNEVESAVSDESPAESSRESIIERQLSLCRAYLDLLLNTSNKRSTKYDELSFLRAKNQELLQLIDQLRHESLLYNSSHPLEKQNNEDVPSMQEQQLISRLEEATDEIDALLQERDQLMKLSNELKFELQRANQHIQSCITSNTMGQESCAQEDEGTGQILDAILSDFSASYDGESHEEPEAVACIGTKPPTGNTANVSAIV
eukprot:scaffold9836_cov164-Skeletonema_dohrnii-CCMP3373.AAC.3